MPDRTPASRRVLVVIVVCWAAAAIFFAIGAVTVVQMMLHAGGLGGRGAIETLAYSVILGGMAITWQRLRKRELERRAWGNTAQLDLPKQRDL